ncbi:DUF58 domain-containing protein [Pseudalkalibacillus berkeleyi]|uniref:DUF58 domain-containing protein n=1 Tax=Pseudalkalibacillus berkeleyi TaxID=1069813 RepID=A0ABS9H6P4_9BACL|nr:DUF58 domain-containing protein [Pseudalkalibacillus berkeleyi]MCF6139548.1 DUF58 domain-containing protein [Pseudalkalibacillus berkeleyi]
MIQKQLARYRTALGIVGIILLIASSFSYAMFQGGFVSWFLFYSVLPLVLYTTFIIFFPLSKISVEREIEKSNFIAGESVEVTIKIHSKLPIPLFYLVINDELPKLLGNHASEKHYVYQSESKALLFPLFKRKASYTYVIKPVPRGIHTFNNVSLDTGDLFGFINKKVSIPLERSIQVYPKTQPLSGWNVFETHPSGIKRAGKQAQQDFTSAVSIRDYTPGDKMSWLHWKATARSNKLVTKVFETQRNDDFVVFLDGSHPGYQRNGQHLFERAVSLAASLLKHAITKGTSVDFHTIAREHAQLSFQSGQNFESKWMYHLARIQPDTKSSLTAVLKHEAHEMAKGVSVLIITPDLSDTFVNTVERMAANKIQTMFFYIAKQKVVSKEEQHLLTRLRARNVVVYAVTIDDFNEVVKAGVQNATS